MLHSLLSPPGLGDVVSLVLFVFADPYLFIGSTTVMTSGLVLACLLLAATATHAKRRAPRVARTSDRVLAWAGPKLALALAYFGVGSMVLATEILIRFHDVNPIGTEMQFRSGIGHLAIALLGIVALRSYLRGLTVRMWVDAHFWALTYLTVHVMLFTPPWFEYQFQLDLVMGVTRAMLVSALTVNLSLWWTVAATRSPAAAAAAAATPATREPTAA